jgi:hypothetical protein
MTWARLDVPISDGGFSVWDLPAPPPTQAAAWQIWIVVILWSIWKSCNHLVFNGVMHSPSLTLRRVCDDLALWRWRLRLTDRAPLDAMRSFILSRV